jgi:hypothetical protein
VSEEQLLTVLTEILAPLVEADEGELYLVESGPHALRLHLGGRFSGCPGNMLVSEGVFLPALRRVDPEVSLEVSSGPIVPQGARRLRARPAA